MRTKIVLGCAAVALAAAGCGNATAGHQNAGQQHPAAATRSTSDPDQAATSAAPTTHPAAKPTTTTAAPTKTSSTTHPAKPRQTSAPHRTAQPAADSRCHTADLWAVFQPLGAAAGNLYGKILLTNHSGATCTVYGYGGISLTAASGAPVPSRQIRDTMTPPMQVTLRPGGHAYSQLHWSDVPGQGESSTGACEPSATGLKVIPPDETRALDAHWPGSPACQHGQIRQGAYRAGTGPASGG